MFRKFLALIMVLSLNLSPSLLAAEKGTKKVTKSKKPAAIAKANKENPAKKEDCDDPLKDKLVPKKEEPALVATPQGSSLKGESALAPSLDPSSSGCKLQ